MVISLIRHILIASLPLILSICMC